MMKKLLLAAALLISLGGCTNGDISDDKETVMSYGFDVDKFYVYKMVENNSRIYVITDKETGVEYIHINNVLIPRYNADGTLKINEKYIGENKDEQN